MSDTRKHRGPHPDDGELFSECHWPALQAAVRDLAWLLTREYALPSALKLVGDRYQLTERQRLAVMRSCCSDQALARRRAADVPSAALAGQILHLDGFNVLTTIEAALAGGVVLRGRDGCDRDLASMHGSYRKVAETGPALRLIGAVCTEFGVSGCVWFLDSPVSNSGRLAGVIREVAQEHGWRWETELVPNPDPVLQNSTQIVVSADSVILDGCRRWTNLAHEVIVRKVPEARVIRFDER